MSSTLADLERRLAQHGGLPAFSSSVDRLLELVHSGASMKKVAEEVQRDPTIATRVLKIANSAFYGLSRQVATLDLAVVLLGLRNVQSIVLGIGCLQILEGARLEGYPGRGFRAHSFLCGQVARYLGRANRLPFQGEEFVVGLIHDIGKLVLARAFPEDTEASVSELRAARGTDLIPMEKQVFGLDHCEVGAWCAKQWKLPVLMVDAIRRHHDVGDRVEDLARLIRAADRASHWLAGIGDAAVDLPAEWEAEQYLAHPAVTAEGLQEVAALELDFA